MTAAATLKELRALAPRRRIAWLRAHPRARTPELVHLLSDEVTALTRVRLTEAVALSQALAWVAARLDDAGARARAWRTRGHIALHQRRYRSAYACYLRALEGFSRAGQPLEGAITRSGALQTLIYMGRYREAFAWAASARRTFIGRNDRLRLARLEVNVGNVLHRHDRFEEALVHYAVALDVFEQGGHTQDEAVVLRNMTVCYIGLNRFAPAMETAERARRRAAGEGLWALVAAVDYNVAYLHYLRGDYPRALQLYDEARLRFEATRDPYHAALCDLDHAELALELNLVDEGAALAASAHQQFQALGLVYERAKARVNQGIAAQRRGNWSDAARHYRSARLLFRREGNAVWTALLDVYLAFVLVEQQRPLDATRMGRQALRRLTRLPFDDRIALAHYVLARAASSRGQWTDARRHCRLAAERLRRHPVPALAYRVWHLRGSVEERAGRHRDAEKAFEQAYRHVESLRGRLYTDPLKIAFLIDKLTVYESVVLATLRAGRSKRDLAFGVMEQAKSRTLVERLSARSAAAAEHGADTEQVLAAAYRRRDEGWRRTESVPSSKALGQQQAERHLRRLEHRAGRSAPPFLASTGIARLLRELQRALSEDSRVIEYYVAGGRLLGWVIGRAHAAVHDLGPIEPALRALAFLQFQLAQCRWKPRGTDSAPAVAHLQALFDILVRPLEGELQQAQHVVFVPHGALHAIPFPALFDGRQFLLDRVTSSVAPSGSVYARTLGLGPSPHAETLIVGVADPAAPWITDEVRFVASVMPSVSLLLGDTATKASFSAAATHASLLHLATHGHFRSDNPDYSSIQLVDGPVTLQDLSSLELDADLITLSGCGTGRLVVAGGDEILGLSRGLLAAGARSLLVALWDISDEATRHFMVGFYEALVRGASRAEANRSGARLVRERQPHPYFWAPFALVGDHRRLPIGREDPISPATGQHPTRM